MRSARKKQLHDKRKLSEERTKRKWVRPVIRPYAIPGADLVLGFNRRLANIDKTGDALDERLAEIARVQFACVFRDCFVRLLQLAEREHDTVAKQWSATLLAWFDGNLGKHRGKLEKVNPEYRKEIAKIGMRADMALPESPVGQILQEELRTAGQHLLNLLFLRELFEEQKDLLLVSVDEERVEQRLRDEAVWQHLRAGSGALWTRKGRREIEKSAREGAADPGQIYSDEVTEKDPFTWQAAARKAKIPEEYWPLADFPKLALDPDAADALELFQESSKKWWAFIWSRIKQKQDKLLPRLRKGKRKRKKLLYLKDFQKQFQNHWQTLMSYREAGTF
jgi:hypothetical protein